MIKTERGDKRRCLACNTAFFDLNRTPIVCPKCDEVFQVVELVHSAPRRGGFPNANGARWRSPPQEAPVDEIDAVSDNQEAEEDAAPASSDDEIPEVGDEVSEVGDEVPEIDDESPDAEMIRQII